MEAPSTSLPPLLVFNKRAFAYGATYLLEECKVFQKTWSGLVDFDWTQKTCCWLRLYYTKLRSTTHTPPLCTPHYTTRVSTLSDLTHTKSSFLYLCTSSLYLFHIPTLPSLPLVQRFCSQLIGKKYVEKSRNAQCWSPVLVAAFVP